nr:hypothetical protein [Saprospiraceae bacterium]
MRYLILLCLLCCFSCSTGTDSKVVTLPPHEWVYINQRIDQFSKQKRQGCINQLMEQATDRVNQTLLNKEELIPIDTIIGLPKPNRPFKPHIREKKDTTPIRPFVDSIPGGN